MKKMNCIHSRRAVNLMKTFINEASDLLKEETFQKVLNPEDDITEWKLSVPYTEILKRDLYIHKGNNFQVIIPDGTVEEFDDDLIINYNFNELFEDSSKLFRACWTQIFPRFKGFADITISLLHELGHLETHNKIRETYSVEDRIFDLIDIEGTAKSKEMANAMYFMLPDEKAATEWANEWLSNPEHRKLAKAFEKKFFACFE